MNLEPLTELSWAYQLHYYLCFETHRRKKLFSSSGDIVALSEALNEICQRHDYHLIRAKAHDDNLRCIFSLHPSNSISKTLQIVKANLSRAMATRLGARAPIWADGFLAGSLGRVTIDVVKKYLNSQAEHHGYATRLRPPVFRFVEQAPLALRAAHSVFDLNHHVVLSTRFRRGVFASHSGEQLIDYWKRVASKKGFAIDRATVVPDHVHLMMRIVPKMSIQEAVLALMNNGQYWLSRHYPHLLMEAGVNQLWQASAYAGTTGRMTTALMKSFLKRND